MGGRRPLLLGAPVYAMAFDSARAGAGYGGPSRAFIGVPCVLVDDYGKTVTEPEAYSVKFPVESELTLKNIWQIMPGRGRSRYAVLRRRTCRVV